MAFDDDPVNHIDPNGHNGLVFFSRPWVMFQRPTPVPRPLLQSPKPGTPPNGMVENLYRPGSFGTGRGSGFKELWRLDKGVPGKPGWGGIDHLHLNGGKPHLPLDTPWGMGPNGEIIPQPVFPLIIDPESEEFLKG